MAAVGFQGSPLDRGSRVSTPGHMPCNALVSSLRSGGDGFPVPPGEEGLVVPGRAGTGLRRSGKEVPEEHADGGAVGCLHTTPRGCTGQPVCVHTWAYCCLGLEPG